MSSKPILYYSIYSPPVRGVLMIIKEIGLDVELRSLALSKGEHLTEEFKKINPQRTVPTLIDDNDFILWDSHAIGTYLVQKYSKKDLLYPKDLKKRAKIDQRLHYDSSILHPLATSIVESITDYGAKEISRKLLDKTAEVYGHLEEFLGDFNYLCGNEMTVADLMLTPMIISIEALIAVDDEQFPKLYNYIKKMSKLSYYDEVNAEGIRIGIKMLNAKLEENNKRY